MIEDRASVERAIPALKAEAGAPWRAQDMASCWRLARTLCILCPSDGVGPDGSGLRLSAYGATEFSFPGHRPSELAILREKAAGALAAL